MPGVPFLTQTDFPLLPVVPFRAQTQKYETHWYENYEKNYKSYLN